MKDDNWELVDYLARLNHSARRRCRITIAVQLVLIPVFVYFIFHQYHEMIRDTLWGNYTASFLDFVLSLLNVSLIMFNALSIFVWASYLRGEWNWIPSEKRVDDRMKGFPQDVQPEPSITCPRCGMTSYHPDDIRYKWCGNCHVWIQEEEAVA